MLKVCFTYLLLIIANIAFGQTEVVSLTEFNSDKLNEYLVNYINQLRTRKRRDPLDYYPALNAAAKNHAVYMADRKYLGHFQKNRKFKTVKDRVAVLGGDADYVGENVQYISINYEIEQANGKLTYQALAKQLGDNWKKSKGHYANMIDKSYQGVAHQFAIKDGLLYACQVFSSKPFQPVFDYQMGTEFKVKNKQPCFDCNRTVKKTNNGRVNFGWYYVENDSVFYYNYKRTFFTYEIPFFRRSIFFPATKRNLHAIFKRKGKLSIDFLHLSQYSCVGKYAYSGAINYDGYYLGYLDKKTIKNNDSSPSKQYVKVYIGQTPKSEDDNYQIDFFLTKKDRPCVSQSTVFISPDHFKPHEYFQLNHPIIKVGTENKVRDSILVKVPFSRNQISEDETAFADLKATLRQLKSDSVEVIALKYSGIASIEGTEAINKKLIAKRATAIASVLSDYYADVTMQSQMIENFDDFRIGLQNKEGDRWLKASEKALRAYANKYKNKEKVASLLDDTRQSEITIYTERNFSSVQLSATVKNLENLVANAESKAALLVYQQLTKKAIVGDSLLTDSLMHVVVPFDSSFAELLWEQFVFDQKINATQVTAKRLNELFAVGAIPSQADYLAYRLMFNLFYDEEICKTDDFATVLAVIKSKNTVNWLNALNLINEFEQGRMQQNLGSALAKHAIKGRFNSYQTYFVSQYIMSYDGLYYAKLLLEKFAKQPRHFPKMYQQYLTLSYYFDAFENKRQLKTDLRVFKNLAKASPLAFCEFFTWYHIGVRALEQIPISKVYCKICR